MTGVFPVSFGGDTEYRRTTATNAAMWLLQRVCLKNALSVAAHTLHRTRIHLIHGSHRRLWPFSTLGWPEKTPELEQFYPTSTMVTGYDIIFFWVIRMVFSGMEQMGEVPFKDVYIHGLIRDEQGRKFSKSLGNGIDPLEVIDKYGADPLRLMLITGNSAGNDMRFFYERLENSRNFLNKLWNASRFILMNLDEEEISDSLIMLTPADKWIISKVNTLAKEVTGES